jgi:hypothetical protein
MTNRIPAAGSSSPLFYRRVGPDLRASFPHPPPQAAKELARHSDIRLTLGRCTHANLSGLADAVNCLPLPGADAEPLTLKDFNPTEVVAVLAVAPAALGAIFTPIMVAPMVAPPAESKRDSTEPSGTDGTKSGG